MGKGPQPDGFTLMEVLVALAIMALALGAMLVLMGQQTRTAVTLEQRQLAQIVAENVLVETMMAPSPPDLGTTVEAHVLGGRDWQSTRVVRETPFGPLQISVSVAREGRTTPITTMTAYRRVGAP